MLFGSAGGGADGGGNYAAFVEQFPACVAEHPPIDWENQVQVFPNPATDQFEVISLHQGLSFNVYAATGQLLQEVTSEAPGRTPVDVSTYPAGVYFIRFRLFGEERVERVVVL